jgi:hypothetical protein
MSLLGTSFWLMLVPGVLFLLLAAGAIIRAVRVPRAARGRPACGGCGHECAVPLTERCPECGGSYAQVGVVTSSLAVRLRGGLLAALVAWTAICAVAAVMIWAAAERHAVAVSVVTPKGVRIPLGMVMSGTSMRRFVITPSGPLNDSVTVKVAHHTTIAEGTTTADTITYVLEGQGTGQTATLSADVRSRCFVFEPDGDGNGLKDRGFAVEDAATFFSRAGFDPEEPTIRTVVESFTDLFRRAMKDTETLQQAAISSPSSPQPGQLLVRANGSSERWAAAPPRAPTAPRMVLSSFALAGLGLLVVYVGGSVLLTTRYRRLVTRSVTQ